MNTAKLLVAFTLGVLVTLSFSTLAEAPSLAKGTVSQRGKAPKLATPSGKASVEILARGQNAFLGLLEMTGGGQVPEHRDATEEYIYILEGSGTLFMEDVPHKVQAGTTVYMPARAKVRFQNGPKPLKALQVFAGPAPAAKYDHWRVVR